MRYLTTKETSIYLGVSIPTLARWRKNNTSPPYLKRGGIIRYSQDDLEKWAYMHKIE